LEREANPLHVLTKDGTVRVVTARLKSAPIGVVPGVLCDRAEAAGWTVTDTAEHRHWYCHQEGCKRRLAETPSRAAWRPPSGLFGALYHPVFCTACVPEHLDRPMPAPASCDRCGAEFGYVQRGRDGGCIDCTGVMWDDSPGLAPGEQSAPPIPDPFAARGWQNRTGV